jgi:hypothetical protein
VSVQPLVYLLAQEFNPGYGRKLFSRYGRWQQYSLTEPFGQ